MSRTRAERKAAKAIRAARVVVEKHREVEGQITAVVEQMRATIEAQHAQLVELRSIFRHVYFGAMLGRALGDEPKLSDALLETQPEMFAGHMEAPWMALSSS